MNTISPVLEAKQISKKFQKVQAVKSLNLSVYPGEIFGLLGPNGAGKTTTLEILEGLQVPDTGEIFMKGLDIRKHLQEIRKFSGIQLQSTSIYEKIRVKEVLDLFSSYYKVSTSSDDLIAKVSLQEKSRSLVKTLSGGQKQRLALALAMVHDPEILFLDEPTTGLDPQARRNIWQIILDLKSQGKTILLTTHYMDEAEQLCDRIAIMDAGEIKLIGTPAELIKQLPVEATIRVNLLEPILPFPTLPGVAEIKEEGKYIKLGTRDLTQTLRALLTLPEAISQKINFHDLQISRSTLEDLFIYLTGKQLRE